MRGKGKASILLKLPGNEIGIEFHVFEVVMVQAQNVPLIPRSFEHTSETLQYLAEHIDMDHQRTLLGLPLELRRAILDFVYPSSYQKYPAPRIPFNKSQNIDYGQFPTYTLNFGWLVHYHNTILFEQYPTLGVNHILKAETLQLIKLYQQKETYEVDLMLVNDSELWVTCLSVPILINRLEKLRITVRNAGFVGGLKDHEHEIWRLPPLIDPSAADKSPQFRRALSDILLDLLQRGRGSTALSGRAITVKELTIDVRRVSVVAPYNNSSRACFPGTPYNQLCAMRRTMRWNEVFLNPQDILDPVVYHMDACLVRHGVRREDGHAVIPTIFECIGDIAVLENGEEKTRYQLETYLSGLTYVHNRMIMTSEFVTLNGLRDPESIGVDINITQKKFDGWKTRTKAARSARKLTVSKEAITS
ncbi:uncharacterized protein LY89DRAFT_719036 [Mollisia scopiformis]|uniref:Uncharacterized protein n=1 Tax=Mollisia scopiformis TaxID=149040 RepID=A0A194X841_MOLSC|nr:uncharacterized protein LY89DRAFT_719036 [Mollisia scopiformis]KUJ16279.1 hypothetical protein LY89DRAFT_719036 [Mollisia scopiformis]